ncbi:UNVERIFIED_CONTAM: hypothetical protein Sradi_6130300 [Sesamum radiatum]|uniref:Uncharacterized protein n=1 Tax=Sesamum radiatum TaxID=300843 RepID=A0AAW2KJM3_SESRA
MPRPTAGRGIQARPAPGRGESPRPVAGRGGQPRPAAVKALSSGGRLCCLVFAFCFGGI